MHLNTATATPAPSWLVTDPAPPPPRHLIGYWSDTHAREHGHTLWLSPVGDMRCVTVVVEAGAPVPLEPGDLVAVGEVAAFVMRFGAGSVPLVPPMGEERDKRDGDSDAAE